MGISSVQPMLIIIVTAKNNEELHLYSAFLFGLTSATCDRVAGFSCRKSGKITHQNIINASFKKQLCQPASTLVGFT